MNVYTPDSGIANTASLSALNAWLAGKTPVFTGTTIGAGGVNFPDAGQPFSSIGYYGADYYTVVLTGCINLPAGTSNFSTESDDGSMLWIDGQQVVSNNNYQGMTIRGGSITESAAGIHSFEIAYYQGNGGAGLLASSDLTATNLLVNGTGLYQVCTKGVANFANAMSVSGVSMLDLAGGFSYAFGPLSIGAGGPSTLHVTSGPASASFAGTTIGNSPVFDVQGGSLVDLGGITATDAGGFTQTGNGTLVVSGNSTLSGPTTISGGTLQLGAGGNAGDLGNTSVIINNGTLAFNRGDAALVFSQTISGSGAVANSGSGTVTLAAANTYSGGTIVNAGGLTAANNLALGSGPLSVASGAAANFLMANPSVGGLSGAGNIVLGNAAGMVNTNLTVNSAGNSTFSGVISQAGAAAGGLIKTGPGTLTLTASSTYSGPTIINNGTIRLTLTAMPAAGSLITELDASTLTPGASSVWPDLSGNGYSLNEGTGARVVAGGMNGRNVVHFNGSQYMYSALDDTSAQYTIVAVAAMDGTQNNRLISSADNNVLFGWWGGRSNMLYLQNWVSGTNSPVDTATHIYAATVSGNNSAATFYDLANSLTPLASGASGNPAYIGQLELGGWSQASELSQGSVAEVDVFNRVLSAAEIAQVQTYLQAKWMGIGLLFNGALPSASPCNLPRAGRWTSTARPSRSPRCRTTARAAAGASSTAMPPQVPWPSLPAAPTPSAARSRAVAAWAPSA